MSKRTAIELFSGIGAFSQAAARHDIAVIAAYDQSAWANRVFGANYGLMPNARNLDTIAVREIPEADVWWMSPPCKPYSVRGQRLDDADPRSASLKNLIALLDKRRPPVVLLENVAAFENSRMHGRLIDQMVGLGYAVHQINLCPTMFGVPMRRQRLFVAAYRKESGCNWRPEQKGVAEALQPLASYLDAAPEPALVLSGATLSKYMQGFDIVDRADEKAVAICFTSGYARCMKVGGSMLRDTTGDIRRFSPREMLRLFGFSSDFVLPEGISQQMCFRLIGNSVDVRSIDYILSGLFGSTSDSGNSGFQTVADGCFLGKKQAKREETL